MHWLEVLLPEDQRRRLDCLAILANNSWTRAHGLSLSNEDAREIVTARNRLLQEMGRVELGRGVIGELIRAFGSSAFLQPGEYASTIIDLLEVFYQLKNDWAEDVADRQLLMGMRELFDQRCAGCVPLLLDCSRDEYLQALRRLRGRRLGEEAGESE